MKKCPVCTSTSVFPEFESKSGIDSTKDNQKDEIYRYYECRECLAEFINPQPPQEEILEKYDIGYGNKSSVKRDVKENSIFVYLKIKRFEIFRGNASALTKFLFWPLIYTYDYKLRNIKKYFKDKSIRLLDFGCGDGTFIKTIDGLFNLKYHLGVDFSIESVKLCKEKGLTVSRSDAWSMNKFEDKFNLITLTHVLEHIPNPREVINKIEECMESGGILIMSLPNTSSIGKIIFGDKWAGYNTPYHLINYRRKTLECLLEGTRFKILEYKTQNFYIHSIDNILYKKKFLGKLRIVNRFIRLLPSFLFSSYGCEQTIICIKE